MKFLFNAWLAIKTWIRKNKDPVITYPANEEEREEAEVVRRNEGAHRKYKRVALVVGHSDDSSGCATYPIKFPPLTGDITKKVREYDLVGWHVDRVKEYIDITSFSMAVMKFLRDGIGRWGVGSAIKKWGADLVISFHVNSIGYKPVTKYREILVHARHKGTWVEEEARRLLDHLNYAHPIEPELLRGDGGIKWVKDGDRASKNLNYYERGGAPCFLIENDFVGYPSKSNKEFLTVQGGHKYCRAIANFCLGSTSPSHLPDEWKEPLRVIHEEDQQE